jgi:hypothetical protein
MKWITTLRTLILVFVGLNLVHADLQAQQKELKILFVGNSYTYGNNLPHIVSILSDSIETKLNTRKSGAIRVPVGPAWELAQEIRPTIDLFTSDGSHPNELGTLLTACIFVKSITGELPPYPPGTFKVEDAAGETLRLMGSDPLDFEFCKRVANEMMDKHQIK